MCYVGPPLGPGLFGPCGQVEKLRRLRVACFRSPGAEGAGNCQSSCRVGDSSRASPVARGGLACFTRSGRRVCRMLSHVVYIGTDSSTEHSGVRAVSRSVEASCGAERGGACTDNQVRSIPVPPHPSFFHPAWATTGGFVVVGQTGKVAQEPHPRSGVRCKQGPLTRGIGTPLCARGAQILFSSSVQ